MEKLLTIAIPTYNRIDSLRKSLGKVLKYMLKPEVEIFVSDNASSDGTYEYMQRITAKYNEVRYYRNEKNLGFSGNFLNCIKHAKGKYLWVLSDDDYIFPDAVNEIMSALYKSPVIVHLDTTALQDDGSTSPPRFYENGLYVTKDKNDFLKRAYIFITFITAMIYRTDYIREIKDMMDYFDNVIPLTFLALKTMRHEGLYVIVTKNCAAATRTSSVKYDAYKTWIRDYGNALLVTGKEVGFNEKVLNDVLYRDYKTHILKSILEFRECCDDSDSWDKNCIWTYINKFDDLIPIYRLVVNAPRQQLNSIKALVVQYKYRNLIDYCFPYKRIFLYGRGKNAHVIANELEKSKIQIAGYIVSDNQNIKNETNVITLSNFRNIFREKYDGIIVTVRREIQPDIEKELKILHINNAFYQDVI